ncbi:MAG: Uma2 family endonuclease [Verrucomicrobiales bacterium]
MASLATPHQFTREAYRKMVESGVLAEDDRVELVRGAIVDKMPAGPSHGACVKRLTRFFTALVASRAIVSVQDPLALGEDSEPEPDLALLAPSDDFYAQSHPGAKDVWLVVEVADSSVAYDLRTKVPLYAEHGIPEVWIVDLQRKELRVFRGPAGGRYLIDGTFRTGDVVPLDVLPGESFPVDACGF